MEHSSAAEAGLATRHLSVMAHSPGRAVSAWKAEPRRIARRDVTRYDRDLIRTIFAECRSSVFASLPIGLARALVEEQYRAHRLDRATRWPHAREQIIEVHGIPAGHVAFVQEDDRTRIVDLAVLPGFRGDGVGDLIADEFGAEGGRRVVS